MPLYKKKKSVESLLASLFIGILSTLALLFLVEYCSHFFIAERNAAIHRQWGIARHPEPYTMFGNPLNSKEEGTNEFGYRSAIPNKIKSSNEYRIFMTGGSTVFLGQPPLAQIIERKLNKMGMTKKIHVFNYGVVSQKSSQELVRILVDIVDNHPDMVLMYNGGNDIMDPYLLDPRPGYPYNFLVYERNPLLFYDFDSYPILPLVLYGSNLMTHFFRNYLIERLTNLEELRNSVAYNTASWRQKIAQIYVTNIKKASKLCKSYDSKFIAFFQPLRYFQKSVSSEYDGSEEAAHAIETRKIVRELIMKDKDLPLVDISDSYLNVKGDVFNDYIHTHQQYKQIIADQMIAKIKNMIH